MVGCFLAYVFKARASVGIADSDGEPQGHRRETRTCLTSVEIMPISAELPH